MGQKFTVQEMVRKGKESGESINARLISFWRQRQISILKKKTVAIILYYITCAGLRMKMLDK